MKQHGWAITLIHPTYLKGNNVELKTVVMGEKKELRDLGYANGWGEGYLPEIVRKCQDAGHKPDYYCDRQSYRSSVTCHECGYVYYYDSSD